MKSSYIGFIGRIQTFSNEAAFAYWCRQDEMNYQVLATL